MDEETEARLTPRGCALPGACSAIERIAKLESRIAELVDLLEEASFYIGYASCHGDKCRLPHCHDCNMEPEDISDFENRMWQAIDGTREGE